MALLFIDDAQTATSGRISGVAGVSAYRYFLVDESNAHLAPEAIVAISRRINNFLTRSFRFRTCRRWSARRKWRLVHKGAHGERVRVYDCCHRRCCFDHQIRLHGYHRGSRDRLAGCNVLPRRSARRRLQVLLDDLKFFRFCKKRAVTRSIITRLKNLKPGSYGDGNIRNYKYAHIDRLHRELSSQNIFFFDRYPFKKLITSKAYFSIGNLRLQVYFIVNLEKQSAPFLLLHVTL